MSLGGVIYEVDAALVGEVVTLRYEPGILTVRNQRSILPWPARDRGGRG